MTNRQESTYPMTMILTRAFALGCIVVSAASAWSGEPAALQTPKDKVNYSIGVSVIRNFKQQGVDMDLERVIQGMKDALSGDNLLMTEEELRATLMATQTDIRQRQRQARRFSGVDNTKEGEAFLAANGKKPGVVVLPSGLQYAVLSPGNGRRPIDEDTVVCHYRARLINGNEVDSTYSKGKPLSYRVKDGVIPGLNEALKLMPIGSKWQLAVPPHLAYGDKGSGTAIGPNETLIFDVELLSIRESRTVEGSR